jgi:hypothetical protein
MTQFVIRQLRTESRAMCQSAAIDLLDHKGSPDGPRLDTAHPPDPPGRRRPPPHRLANQSSPPITGCSPQRGMRRPHRVLRVRRPRPSRRAPLRAARPDRSRRSSRPARPRRMGLRPAPRPIRSIRSMLSRCDPPANCSRPLSPVTLTRTQIGRSQPCNRTLPRLQGLAFQARRQRVPVGPQHDAFTATATDPEKIGRGHLFETCDIPRCGPRPECGGLRSARLNIWSRSRSDLIASVHACWSRLMRR